MNLDLDLDNIRDFIVVYDGEAVSITFIESNDVQVTMTMTPELWSALAIQVGTSMAAKATTGTLVELDRDDKPILTLLNTAHDA